MSKATATTCSLDKPVVSTSWLLQLPEPALELVLQKLDKRSLFRTAATCSKFRHAIPATICQVEIRCPYDIEGEMLASFSRWVERHRTCLTNLQQCCLVSYDLWENSIPLRGLHLPHLRNLRLQGWKLQLEAAGGFRGVLRDCTGLTALHLGKCHVHVTPGACAAIAALPDLQQLTVSEVCRKDRKGGCGRCICTLFLKLQHPQRLTHLSLRFSPQPEQLSNLQQLSALSNLQNLELMQLPAAALPGGLPPQLVQLTGLIVQCPGGLNAATFFQHLSCLTALQELKVDSNAVKAEHLAGVGCLSQLTYLEISSSGMGLTVSNTQAWARLPALRSLVVSDCGPQPDALAAFTQLQTMYACRLDYNSFPEPPSSQALLLAVGKLSSLTQLVLCQPDIRMSRAPAAAFTALTASTHLAALKLSWATIVYPPQDFQLFKAGAMCPHLRHIDLEHKWPTHKAPDYIPVTAHQLQLLCGACPALETLTFVLDMDPPPTACLPLQQLTALTLLKAHELGAAAEAAVGAAARLTQLEYLQLTGVPNLPGPVLLPLTALTSLKQLSLKIDGKQTHSRAFTLCDIQLPYLEDCDTDPSGVCADLLRHLLGDKACRQVLLQRSHGDTAVLAAELLARGITAREVQHHFKSSAAAGGAALAAARGYVVGDNGEVELIDSEASYDSD